MDNRAIGVFDSGLGGLTAVRELIARLPGEDIVYFGDTGRVPYGSRGEAVITRYARQDAAFLLRHGVKAIVCACGTVSSVAGEKLADELPCPFFPVLEPTVRAACAATRNGRIGVIGTAATIRTGKFQQMLAGQMPEAEIFSAPCPLLVPLAEAGHIAGDDPVTALVLREYLAPMAEARIDTLILGCTHYPILADAIDRFFGGTVSLIDSGRETALEVRRALARQGLLKEFGGEGKREYYVTDEPYDFSRIAAIFMNDRQVSAHRVEIPELEQTIP